MIYIVQGWSLKLLSWARNLFCWFLLTRFFSKDLRIANPSQAKPGGQNWYKGGGLHAANANMLCSLIGWRGGGVSCKYPRYCRWFWLVRFSAKTLCFFFSQFCWRDTKFPIIEYILCSKCYLYLYIVTLKVMSWLGVYIYTWNLFVLYFWASTIQNKVFSNQNRGHFGSRYTYIIYI